jgi:hypothetical protein
MNALNTWVEGRTRNSSIANYIKTVNANKPAFTRFNGEFTHDAWYYSVCTDGATAKILDANQQQTGSSSGFAITFADYDFYDVAIGYRFELVNGKIKGYRTKAEVTEGANGNDVKGETQSRITDPNKISQHLEEMSEDEVLEFLGKMIESKGDEFSTTVFPTIQEEIKSMLTQHFSGDIKFEPTQKACDLSKPLNAFKTIASYGIPSTYITNPSTILNSLTFTPDTTSDIQSQIKSIEECYDTLGNLPNDIRDLATLNTKRKNALEEIIENRITDGDKKKSVQIKLEEALKDNDLTQAEIDNLTLEILKASIPTPDGFTLVASPETIINALNKILPDSKFSNDNSMIFNKNNEFWVVRVDPLSLNYQVTYLKINDDSIETKVLEYINEIKYDNSDAKKLTLYTPETTELTQAQKELSDFANQTLTTDIAAKRASVQLSELTEKRDEELKFILANLISNYHAYQALGGNSHIDFKAALRSALEVYVVAGKLDDLVETLSKVPAANFQANFEAIWSRSIKPELISVENKSTTINSPILRAFAEIKNSGNQKEIEIIEDGMLQIARGKPLTLRQKHALKSVLKNNNFSDINKFDSLLSKINSNKALDYDPQLKELINNIPNPTFTTALTSDEFYELLKIDGIPPSVFSNLSGGMKLYIQDLPVETQKKLIKQAYLKTLTGDNKTSDTDSGSTVTRTFRIPESLDWVTEPIKQEVLEKINFSSDPIMAARYLVFLDTIKNNPDLLNGLDPKLPTFKNDLIRVLDRLYRPATQMPIFQENKEADFGINPKTLNAFINIENKKNIAEVLARFQLIELTEYEDLNNVEKIDSALKKAGFMDNNGYFTPSLKTKLQSSLGDFLRTYQDTKNYPERYEQDVISSYNRVFEAFSNIFGNKNLRNNSEVKKVPISRDEFIISFTEFLQFAGEATK